MEIGLFQKKRAVRKIIEGQKTIYRDLYYDIYKSGSMDAVLINLLDKELSDSIDEELYQGDEIMDEVYTLPQIKERWEDYQKAKAWRVLRGGKWRVYKKAPDTTDGATRAEMIKLKDHISFPKFIEVFNA